MKTTKSVRRYAYLMNQCGFWPIARMLYKQGYPVNYALFCSQYSALTRKVHHG
jgi:hypothetical protein